MIELSRLNGTKFILNAELIEQIESTPDTIITLISGNNIVVKESARDVVQKVTEYRRRIMAERNTKIELRMSERK